MSKVVDAFNRARWQRLSAAADRMTVYRSAWSGGAGAHCAALLRALADGHQESAAPRYAALVGALLERPTAGSHDGDLWRAFLVDTVLTHENPFTLAAESGGTLSHRLREAAAHDLARFESLHAASGQDITNAVQALTGEPFPSLAGAPDSDAGAHRDARWRPPARAWERSVVAVAEAIAERGCGVFSQSYVLRCDGTRDPVLKPVAHPDPVRLEDLVGYEAARQVVVENTERLLAGRPAHNLLLYGDRGTGKSATVKALVHRFGPRGLRLIEVSRDRLHLVGPLLRLLRGRGLSHLLFVDELTFGDEESDYRQLKCVLEGSVEARPGNVAFIATSNRRHLVRERFSDRRFGASGTADDVHRQDTMQERLALADRFGRTVIFASPDQHEYLQIVEGIAVRKGIPFDKETLHSEALRWAVQHNGRSGRTARQFIDDWVGRGDGRDGRAGQ